MISQNSSTSLRCNIQRETQCAGVIVGTLYDTYGQELARQKDHNKQIRSELELGQRQNSVAALMGTEKEPRQADGV